AMIGLTLIIMLAVGIVSYSNTSSMRVTAGLVTHTHLVLENLEGVLKSLIDTETGERGYIITTDESYLEPYTAAVDAVDQRVTGLAELTVDTPDQQRNLDALKPLIKTELEFLKGGVDAAKSKVADAGRQWVLTGTGKKNMDALRSAVGKMEDV